VGGLRRAAHAGSGGAGRTGPTIQKWRHTLLRLGVPFLGVSLGWFVVPEGYGGRVREEGMGVLR
jgi:hypothetical protein